TLPDLTGVVTTVGLTGGMSMALVPNPKLDPKVVANAQANPAPGAPNFAPPAVTPNFNPPGTPNASGVNANVLNANLVVNPYAEMKLMPPDPEDPTGKPVVYAPAEVSWNTDDGKVDVQKLIDAFTKAGIPDAAAYTQFLRVQLVRQEMLPS